MIVRVIVIVLDGLGIGALPDASNYNDQGSNTLGSVIDHVPDISIPNLHNLGLNRLIRSHDTAGSPDSINGCYGSMAEKSPGKDTTTGHWELMGLELSPALPTYPHGFPRSIIEKFETLIHTKVLCNKPASGTDVINEFGDEHCKTGYPIVYTSADSVFQIAAHVERIPVMELYRLCTIARHMLINDHAVGRVIARPFNGRSGSYTRTHERKDFSVLPPGRTILDEISGSGMSVAGIGKINDVFSGRGITSHLPAKDNKQGIEGIITSVRSKNQRGLIFCNLIDFDMVYGHRNNIRGFAGALEYFDNKLLTIINAMSDEDVLFITADHGCDPAFPGTDHTREYVPVLGCGRHIKQGIDLGIRKSFADLGATIIDLFGLPPWPVGSSFWREIYRK